MICVTLTRDDLTTHARHKPFETVSATDARLRWRREIEAADEVRFVEDGTSRLLKCRGARLPRPAWCSPPEPGSVSLDRQIARIEGDLTTKRVLYRRRVAVGDMTKADADADMAETLAVLDTLRELARQQREATAHAA